MKSMPHSHSEQPCRPSASQPTLSIYRRSRPGKFQRNLAAALGAADLVGHAPRRRPLSPCSPHRLRRSLRLPQGTVENPLLKPRGTKGTLSGHFDVPRACPVKVMAAQVVNLPRAPKRSTDQRVDISVKDSTVMVDGATVVQRISSATNGADSCDRTPSFCRPTKRSEDGSGSGCSSARCWPPTKAGRPCHVLASEGPVHRSFRAHDARSPKLPKGTVRLVARTSQQAKTRADF